MAEDPAFRGELEAARRLGISHRRFLGWEPEREYTYGEDGLLICSRADSEWDDAERAKMLALAEYEAGLCPKCGLPLDVCTAAENEGKFHTDVPVRCHRTTAELQASEGLDKYQHPDALLFRTSLSD